MRKVIVHAWMSLDGVGQAPGAPEEDTSGGFAHGGWHIRYFDEGSRQWVASAFQSAGGFLFGRRTFEILAGYWPHASGEEQVIAEPLNTRTKYVASTTLTEPLVWKNSTLLEGDVARAVADLKQQDGGDLLVVGSTSLVRTLIGNDLVDELQVMIDPLLVGGGKRFFPEDGSRRPFRLVDGVFTSTGAILATYAPAND